MNIGFQDPKFWSDPKIVIELDECETAEALIVLLREQASQAMKAEMWGVALKWLKAADDLDKASNALCEWKIAQEGEA